MISAHRCSVLTETTLNALLRGEISAVECYLVTLGSSTAQDLSAIRQPLRMHRDRLQMLHSYIIKRGGTPYECMGPWVWVTRQATILANYLGNPFRKALLASGESFGSILYGTSMHMVDQESRDFISSMLQPAAIHNYSHPRPEVSTTSAQQSHGQGPITLATNSHMAAGNVQPTSVTPPTINHA